MHNKVAIHRREFRDLLTAVHDAVSSGLRLEEDSGIDFRWELAGWQLDTDLDCSLGFTAICRDPRIARLALTGLHDGTALLAHDVQRANKRLRPVALMVRKSTVDGFEEVDGSCSQRFARVRLDFAITATPLDVAQDDTAPAF